MVVLHEVLLEANRLEGVGAVGEEVRPSLVEEGRLEGERDARGGLALAVAGRDEVRLEHALHGGARRLVALLPVLDLTRLGAIVNALALPAAEGLGGLERLLARSAREGGAAGDEGDEGEAVGGVEEHEVLAALAGLLRPLAGAGGGLLLLLALLLILILLLLLLYALADGLAALRALPDGHIVDFANEGLVNVLRADAAVLVDEGERLLLQELLEGHLEEGLIGEVLVEVLGDGVERVGGLAVDVVAVLGAAELANDGERLPAGLGRVHVALHQRKDEHLENVVVLIICQDLLHDGVVGDGAEGEDEVGAVLGGVVLGGEHLEEVVEGDGVGAAGGGAGGRGLRGHSYLSFLLFNC